MRSRRLIKGATRKLGNLLSTILLISTLFLSSFAIAETHEGPCQAIAVAVVVASHIPAKCHAFAYCTAYVVPSEMSHLAMEAVHRRRFLQSEDGFFNTFNPVFNTPPPRV